MRKFFIILVCLIFLSGCTTVRKDNKKVEEKDSNVLEKLKEEDIYNVEYKKEEKKINDNLVANITRVNVSSKKKDGSKKINEYLNKVIDSAYLDFESAIKEEYLEDSSYMFDYKYSLVSQNNKYISFKLHFFWQVGGPYPTEADEYFMFNINTGEIVNFDELFTKDIKNETLNYILKYLKDLYKKNDMIYNETDYEMDSLFDSGYFLLNDNKLTFSLPRSYFTVSALGSLSIDIDKSIYISHIK